MIDTHSHIYSEEFDSDREEVIINAKNVGVEGVVLANVDSSSIARLRDTQSVYPDFCTPAMGLHPTSVDKEYPQELEKIKMELEQNPYSAIGEIGLDLYWDTAFREEQKIVFARQIEWALDLDIPIIVHIRKAFEDAFEVLKRFKGNMPRGVFHCFSGGLQEAIWAQKMGFKLGIGGVLTYKNSNLKDIISQIDLENLLLETDAPYLSPTPYRGKRNEPKYMIEVLHKMSEIFGLSEEKIDTITTNSAKELFNIK